MEEKVCCPPFDPKPWERTFVTFDDKFFVKSTVRTFKYMPLNFGSVMRKTQEAIEAAGAKVVDNIVLSNHLSKRKMEVLTAIDKEVPELKPIKLKGKFLCNVYEGPFKNTAIWGKDFERLAKDLDFTINTWYMWYTTCPKCAKKYGKNYVVILAD